MLASKYANHQPLYRRIEIYAPKHQPKIYIAPTKNFRYHVGIVKICLTCTRPVGETEASLVGKNAVRSTGTKRAGHSKGMLNETPAPSLEEAIRRLGRTSRSTVTRNHRELSAAILARNREQRAEYLAAITSLVDELLDSPTITLQDVLDAIGKPKLKFKKMLPDLYRRVMEKCKACLVGTRALQLQKAESEVRRARDELRARGVEPALGEVMNLLTEGPYLWSKNVSAILKRLEKEDNAVKLLARSNAA